jgi:hypothetical protein
MHDPIKTEILERIEAMGYPADGEILFLRNMVRILGDGVDFPGHGVVVDVSWSVLLDAHRLAPGPLDLEDRVRSLAGKPPSAELMERIRQERIMAIREMLS